MESKSGRKRRSFTDEFKRDAVKLISVEGYSFKEAAAILKVNVKNLREWHERFAPEPKPCGPDATLGDLQAENRRLRDQLKEAETDLEILKKATAYFAKESQ